MIVYRVEHCDGSGLGPYQHGHSDAPAAEDTFEIAADLEIAHASKPSHPAPENPHAGLCGCDSLESLAQWFDGFGDELDAAGFVVVAYEANEDEGEIYERTGAGQVVFSRCALRGPESLIDWN